MAYARLRVTERGNVRSGFFFGTLLRGLVCELLHPPFSPCWVARRAEGGSSQALTRYMQPLLPILKTS